MLVSGSTQVFEPRFLRGCLWVKYYTSPRSLETALCPRLRESSGASPAGRELQPPGALPQLLLCDEPTAACDLETDSWFLLRVTWVSAGLWLRCLSRFPSPFVFVGGQWGGVFSLINSSRKPASTSFLDFLGLSVSGQAHPRDPATGPEQGGKAWLGSLSIPANMVFL